MAKKSEPLTIKKELEWAVPFLHSQGITSPRLEAEVLLAKILGWDRVKLLTHLTDPLAEPFSQLYRERIATRATGYPLQYLTGSQEFMSLEFRVTPDVLIPRDDTEILVQAVLDLKPKVTPDPTIVDIGTGSGIVAVTLKKHWPEAKVCAVDISPEGLAVAQANACRHNVEISFYQGNLLDPFRAGYAFDIIVSNPPYIPSQTIAQLQVEVTKEPTLALDGGPDGLQFYHRLAMESQACLAKSGWLAVEIGSDQGTAVQEIFKANGFQEVQLIHDHSGLDRVVVGQLRVNSEEF